MDASLPAPLQTIIEDFQFSEGREKVELLLDFAQRMPPLPEHLQDNRQSMDLVEECMTPVLVYAEEMNGKMKFYFDVPPESPTVRGYAAIMAQGLDGATAEEVLKIPSDFYLAMGLQDVLTHQRLNGISAILGHMKQLALKHVSPDSDGP